MRTAVRYAFTAAGRLCVDVDVDVDVDVAAAFGDVFFRAADVDVDVDVAIVLVTPFMAANDATEMGVMVACVRDTAAACSTPMRPSLGLSAVRAVDVDVDVDVVVDALLGAVAVATRIGACDGGD